MLILVMIVGLSMGLWVSRAKTINQRRAVQKIEAWGGLVSYDYQYESGVWKSNGALAAPRWLRALVGDDSFRKVTHVVLDRRTIAASERPIATLRFFAGLPELTLVAWKFEEGDLDDLAGLFDLIALDLKGADISGSEIDGLARLPQLRKLDLSSSNVTDRVLQHIGKLGELRHLELGYCKLITDTSIEHLKSLAELRVLNLERCDRITNIALVALSELPHLEDLNVIDAGVDDRGLAHLVRSTSLAKLHINDSTLTNLGKLRNLRDLELIVWDSKNESLEHLAELSNLEKLRIRLFGYHDKNWVKSIRKLRKLRSLDASYRSKFIDDDMEIIKEIISIDELSIPFSGLSDIGLMKLSELHSLRSLDVRGTRVTAQGIEALKRLVPTLVDVQR